MSQAAFKLTMGPVAPPRCLTSKNRVSRRTAHQNRLVPGECDGACTVPVFAAFLFAIAKFLADVTVKYLIHHSI